MTIINKLNPKPVNRKNFLLYSGFSLLSIFVLFKYPLRYFRNNKNQRRFADKGNVEIVFKENPEAVKRNSLKE